MAMTSAQSALGMRAMRPSRVMPALLTSTSRSPASSTSRFASLGIADVGLNRSAADLARNLLRLVGPGAVVEDDLGVTLAAASSAAIARPMPRDAPRTSALALERGEALGGAVQLKRRTASRRPSSAARLFTETVFTPLSILLTKPERTLPGPTSTNVYALLDGFARRLPCGT